VDRRIRQFLFGTGAHVSQDFHRFGTPPLYLVVFTLDTTGTSPHNARTLGCLIGFSGEVWLRQPPRSLPLGENIDAVSAWIHDSVHQRVV
jgi:hypothetical protein